jgi:S1-C subfamily serine protease
MKLYSRGQVALAALICSGLAVALSLGLYAALHSKGASSYAPVAVQAEPIADVAGASGQNAAASADGEPRQPRASADVLPVQTLSSAYSQEEQQTIAVYEANNEAVVNITTEVMALNWFMEPVPQGGGTGSGSIIDVNGTYYVLTNNHVVDKAFKLTISFADGSSVEGKVRGVDEENDLALLSFDPPAGKALKTIAFGDSSQLKVGQKVLAIGNPFGLDRTLTDGIVSALGRPIQTEDTIMQNMIQTDAAINPGNSGGPLLNTRGEMIGINTMIYSQSGGSNGIGFAVPVNTAKRVVADLVKYGSVKRGWIEITGVQLFPQLVSYMKQNGFPVSVESGYLISDVKKGGNADKAGLKGGTQSVRYYRNVFKIGGDIIVGVDGKAVASYADFRSALEDNRPGEKVKVEYYRGNKKYTVEVVLSDRSESVD